jgi:hypothetical protein
VKLNADRTRIELQIRARLSRHEATGKDSQQLMEIQQLTAKQL